MDKKKRYKKLWYIKNKKYILCKCGSKVLEYNIDNHNKTDKHKGIEKIKKTKVKEVKKVYEIFDFPNVSKIRCPNLDTPNVKCYRIIFL